MTWIRKSAQTTALLVLLSTVLPFAVGADVTAVNGGNDDSYNTFKGLNATSATGTPSFTNFAGYLKVVNGSDSTTGQGSVAVNWDKHNIDGPEDLDVTNTTNHRVLFYFESFDAGTNEAEIWFHGDVTRDGSEQFRLHVGGGSTAENVSHTTVFSGVPNLQARYSLREEAGGTGNADVYLDSSGNNNHGDDEVSATGQTGQFADGQNFDGADDYIGIGDVAATTFSGSFTVYTWAKYDNTGSNEYTVAKFDGGSNRQYLLWKGSDEAWRGRFTHSSGQHTLQSNTDFSANTWYHMVMTLDTDNNVFTGYADGTQFDQISTSNTPQDSDAPLRIGQDGDGDFPFSGDIDEVRLYDTGISSDRVQANYDMSPKSGQTLFAQQAAGTDDGSGGDGGGGTGNTVAVSVNQPESGVTYTDQRVVLDASLNATGDIMYSIDGGSNTTACTDCTGYTHNITAFGELSEGSHTLNVYGTDVNTDKESVSFTYAKDEVYIPEYPYGTNFSFVMNFHDYAATSDEINIISNTLQELNADLAVPAGQIRSWNSTRFTFGLMPMWTVDGTDYWLNMSNANQSLLTEQIGNYSLHKTSGPIEYAYHTQSTPDETGQPTGSYASNATEHAHFQKVFSMWNETLGYTPRSSIGGWRNYDRYTERNLYRRDAMVEYTGSHIRSGLKKQPVNDTYFEASISTSDYTSTGAENIGQATATFNYYDRQTSDADIAIVKFVDMMGSGQLRQTATSTLKSELNAAYQRGDPAFVVHDHVSTPEFTDNRYFDQAKIKNLSKWYYNTYVDNQTVDARFATPSELGYQRLGRQTATVKRVTDNSTAVVYNLSSPEHVHWFTFGLNKSYLDGRDNKFQVNHGDGWKDLSVERETEDRYWLQTHLSDAQVQAIEDSTDTTPPTTTDNWTKTGWQSQDAAEVELTCTDASSSCDQISYQVDSAGWTTVSGSSTTLTIAGSGNHTLEYNSTDTAGNTEAVNTEYVALSAPNVVLKDGVRINQPGNNAAINVTSTIHTSSLTAYSDATNFGGSNFSIAGSTNDPISVKLDHYNASVQDAYAANYSVDTADGNNVTFGFTDLVTGSASFYDVFFNTVFDRQYNPTGGELTFWEASWTTGYDGFDVKHTTNGKPRLTDGLLRDDRKQSVTRLEFTVDDRGEADIRSYRGAGATNTFTNTSLSTDIALPVTSIYNVTDTGGRTSTGVPVDVSRTDSELRESAYSHTLDTQQTNRTVTFTNDAGTGIDYNITFANYGTAQVAESFAGTIPTSGSVAETGVWQGDDLTGETEGTAVLLANNSAQNSVSRQHLVNRTNLTVTNNRGFTYSDVDLSSQCSTDTAADVPGGTTEVTDRCNNHSYPGDYVDEQEYAFVPDDTVTLGVNYIGQRPVQLANRQPVPWTGLDTTGAVTEPVQCSQTNNTAVDLGPSATTNYTVELSCNPGTIGNPTQTVLNVSDDTERVWYNSTDMAIHSNETETSTIAIRADKANVKNPNDRDGGSLRAYVEGVSSTNNSQLNVTDTGAFFRIEIGDEFQNSSLHTTDDEWSVTYTLSGDSTTIIVDDGGGGGGGGDDGSTEAAITVDLRNRVVSVLPEGTAFAEFTVRNFETQSNTVTYREMNGTGCEFISLQRTLTSDQYGDEATYAMDAAPTGESLFDADRRTLTQGIRIEMPNQTRFDELAGPGGTLACTYTGTAELGRAESFTVRVDTGSDPFAQVQQLLFDLFGFPVFTEKSFTFGLCTLQPDTECTAENSAVVTVPWPTARGGAVLGTGVFILAIAGYSIRRRS